MSQAKWLVAAVVPGVEREPLKRLVPGGAQPPHYSEETAPADNGGEPASKKARKTTRKLSKAERSEAIKKGIWRNRLVRKRRAEAEAKRT